MWTKLRGVSTVRAICDVAFRIGCITSDDRDWLLRELEEPPDEGEAAVRAAIVLVQGSREAYWNGKPIQIDWHKHSALWDSFCDLVEHSKRRIALDANCFEREAHPAALNKLKSRLINMRGFPHDLARLIKPAGRGQQRLELLRNRIEFVELVETLNIRRRPR